MAPGPDSLNRSYSPQAPGRTPRSQQVALLWKVGDLQEVEPHWREWVAGGRVLGFAAQLSFLSLLYILICRGVKN